MIHWYHDLFVDEAVEKNVRRAKKNVEKGLGNFKRSMKLWKKSYYAIMLAANPDNVFDIIETRQLFFRHYKNTELYIVALAENKESAVKLLQKMIELVWEKDEKLRIRDYFVQEDFD